MIHRFPDYNNYISYVPHMILLKMMEFTNSLADIFSHSLQIAIQSSWVIGGDDLQHIVTSLVTWLRFVKSPFSLTFEFVFIISRFQE